MKKISLLFCLNLVTVLSYGMTCPPAKDIFVWTGSRYSVKPPAGWMVVVDDRPSGSANLKFRIAAWGNHKYEYDNVRCHYYDYQTKPVTTAPKDYDNHVELQTLELIAESRITAYPQYWDSISDLYHMCGNFADDVNGCPFN